MPIEYAVHAGHMCMNKVLVSRYKKVTFPIVSYPELVEIISGATRE